VAATHASMSESSLSAGGEGAEDGAEFDEALALSGDEDEAASEIKSHDRRRARDCAEDIAAAVEVNTPADAIKALTAAIPDWRPAEGRSLLVSRLKSPKLKFFPTRIPSLTLHPESTQKNDALWALTADEVMRVPSSRASCNLYQTDMIVEVAGVEWLICGFILPHITSADKLHLYQDLTKQPATADWLAVLYHAALLDHQGTESNITTEVCRTHASRVCPAIARMHLDNPSDDVRIGASQAVLNLKAPRERTATEKQPDHRDFQVFAGTAVRDWAVELSGAEGGAMTQDALKFIAMKDAARLAKAANKAAKVKGGGVTRLRVSHPSRSKLGATAGMGMEEIGGASPSLQFNPQSRSSTKYFGAIRLAAQGIILRCTGTWRSSLPPRNMRSSWLASRKRVLLERHSRKRRMRRLRQRLR